MTGVRFAVPGDYDAIAAVVDEWWGRPVLPSLPRLFLDHFHRTSFVAEGPGGGLAGFLVGLVSPSLPGEAYIHFVGVSPDVRAGGLGRRLYGRFFELARDRGCHVVRAITSPVNEASIAFHRRLGFTASPPVPGYNGPGNDLVTFSRPL
ncbi:GNAT family N-acetyltransferase [Nonomuraea sp. SBT364]|uniref:GNAT family N-acetyltransferase n=1 Tax=Nonomuraea sp. SBT364 TaxID=1580530 RepID=UPI001E366030|nr:GNAT family N-acetyltransferase [Nonomuraea sp. SBT364]